MVVEVESEIIGFLNFLAEALIVPLEDLLADVLAS